jgi:proline iminopeptidase
VVPGSYTAKLDGFDIHYEIHGSGPVLMVMPNSWGLSLEGLRGLFRPLEERLTVVYFDPRGMGGSSAVDEPQDRGMQAVRADFDALRRHLRLDRVDALGWSNGAMNLMLHAGERPETIGRAIFLHGVAHFGEEDVKRLQEEHPDLLEKFSAFRQEMENAPTTAEERDARTKQFYLQVWFPALFADPTLASAKLPAVFADAEFSYGHLRYADTDSAAFDARPSLSRIQASSLVIAGPHDLLPPARVEEVHLAIPRSRFVVFERSGHFSPVEETDRFVATVVEFLGVSPS